MCIQRQSAGTKSAQRSEIFTEYRLFSLSLFQILIKIDLRPSIKEIVSTNKGTLLWFDLPSSLSLLLALSRSVVRSLLIPIETKVLGVFYPEVSAASQQETLIPSTCLYRK